MEDYANSHSLPGLVEEYSEGNYSDGEQFAQLSVMPTPHKFWRNDKTMEFSNLSRFGMTFAIAFWEYRRKMYAWTKNTDTVKRGTALFAENHLHRETRDRRNNAARTLAEACCRQGKRNGHAQSAERRSSHRAQGVKPVLANAGRCLGSRVEPLTQWSRSGSGLRCFAALSLQDAFVTRQTEPPHCLVILSRNYGHILRRISSQACHGKTTAKGLTHGA